MSIRNILRKQIEIIKQIIRFCQLLIAMKKNEPKPSEREIIFQIYKIASLYTTSGNLAVKVARCESGLDPFVMNFNSRSSIDRGLFQINNLYHPKVSDREAFNYKKSIHFFCQAVQDGNLYWWNSSKHCWGYS